MRFASNVRFPSRLISIVVVAMLAIINCPFAHADFVVYSGTYFDILVSDPIDVGTSNTLKAVTLTATGLATDSKPNTFDCTKSGTEEDSLGIWTAGNYLHQVGWLTTDVPPLPFDIYTPTNYQQIAATLDTHFLIDPPEFIGGSPNPEETMIVQNTDDHQYGHYGNYLRGNFTLDIDVELLPTTWEFARIVATNGTEINLDFEIAGIHEGGGVFDRLTTSFMIPEPGALMLLVTGIFGLLVYAWRRRN